MDGGIALKDERKKGRWPPRRRGRTDAGGGGGWGLEHGWSIWEGSSRWSLRRPMATRRDLYPLSRRRSSFARPRPTRPAVDRNLHPYFTPYLYPRLKRLTDRSLRTRRWSWCLRAWCRNSAKQEAFKAGKLLYTASPTRKAGPSIFLGSVLFWLPRPAICLSLCLIHLQLNLSPVFFPSRFQDIIARFGRVEAMPREFFTDFVKIARDEGRHFTLLAERLEELGTYYGALPAHDGLWDSALETSKSLLARLAVEHCVHEVCARVLFYFSIFYVINHHWDS